MTDVPPTHPYACQPIVAALPGTPLAVAYCTTHDWHEIRTSWLRAVEVAGAHQASYDLALTGGDR